MARELAKEFGVAKSRVRHGLILTVGLLALGGWILLLSGESIPDRHLIGLLALGLGFGLGCHTWWTARQAGAQLRIDDRGIWFKDWGATVPWGQIVDVYQTGHRLQPFVTLRLKQPELFMESLPEAEAGKLRGNRLWKAPELKIPNGAVEATQLEMLDLLRTGLESHAASDEDA